MVANYRTNFSIVQRLADETIQYESAKYKWADEHKGFKIGHIEHKGYEGVAASKGGCFHMLYHIYLDGRTVAFNRLRNLGQGGIVLKKKNTPTIEGMKKFLSSLTHLNDF